MEFFQRFLNRAGRAYGQADKRLFGGMLPGGADSPLVTMPQSVLSPSSIVRSAPFQAVRDVALEKSGLPKPEQFYIKGMTGGSKDITTMTPEELALVKGAYEQKQNFQSPSDQDIFMLAKQQELMHQSFVKKLKEQYAKAPEENKNSPLGKMIFNTINTPFNLDEVVGNIKTGVNAAQKAIKNSGPVVNLYGQGRNMKMAYGNLSVYPQPGGGVQIYDRWKVDKPEQLMPGLGKIGIKDKVDAVSDLGEGGPIPALIYNAAKALGTYEPFDIRVNVSPQDWQNIQGRVNTTIASDRAKEEQGSTLNYLNTLYQKTKDQIVPPIKALPPKGAPGLPAAFGPNFIPPLAP